MYLRLILPNSIRHSRLSESKPRRSWELPLIRIMRIWPRGSYNSSPISKQANSSNLDSNINYRKKLHRGGAQFGNGIPMKNYTPITARQIPHLQPPPTRTARPMDSNIRNYLPKGQAAKLLQVWQQVVAYQQQRNAHEQNRPTSAAVIAGPRASQDSPANQRTKP